MDKIIANRVQGFICAIAILVAGIVLSNFYTIWLNNAAEDATSEWIDLKLESPQLYVVPYLILLSTAAAIALMIYLTERREKKIKKLFHENKQNS